MLSTVEILKAALVHGLVLSVALAAVIVASLRRNAEMWLGDYPPDIRRAFGPMSEEARRQRVPWAILFALVFLGGLGLGVAWLSRTVGSPGWWHTFLYVFVLVTTFNVFDLAVLDWLWFVRLRPSFIVLPGTEGMEGYRDYGFHLRAFLIGLAGTCALALVTATITAVVSRI